MAAKEDRKNFQWRVEKHPSKDKLNKWLDAQYNGTESLANIVIHLIGRFGYENITDYDIQKVLYQEFAPNSVKDYAHNETEQEQTAVEDSVNHAGKKAKETPKETNRPDEDIDDDLDLEGIEDSI